MRSIRLVGALLAAVVVCAASAGGASATTNGVMAWGEGTWGQLGNGTEHSSTVPFTLTQPVGVKAVASGGQFSLALLESGKVMAWGYNSSGQLGNGSTSTESRTPVEVSGLSGVVAIAAGADFGLALLENGKVMAWGDNSDGQLGDGTTTLRRAPVEVHGLTEVKAISAGWEHSLALLESGHVMAWGRNRNGELGDGSTVDRHEPVEISGLASVTAVGAGGLSSIALLEGGTVKSWGDNLVGELGVGSEHGPETCVITETYEREHEGKEETVEREHEEPCSRKPVTVSAVSGATAIAAGGEANVVMGKEGTVEAMGQNLAGELGNGSETGPETCEEWLNGVKASSPCSRVPVKVAGLSGATAITAGVHFALALVAGTVVGWGANDEGQLGVGTRNGPESCPFRFELFGEGYFQVSSGCSRTIVKADEFGSGVLGISAGGWHGLAYGPAGPTVTGLSPARGPAAGGSSVVITGAHFTGATNVKFGANAASFTVNSDTQITATAPAGSAGSVHVTVTTPSGTIEPSGEGSASVYRYVSAGAPEFGTCAKVKSGSGNFKTGTCTTELPGSSFEWTPGLSAKAGFTLSGGAATFESASKAKVTCTGLTGSGEYTGTKSVSAAFTLTGCALSGVKCSSASHLTGEVATPGLEGVVGFISREPQTIGVSFSTPGESAPFAEFNCGPTQVTIYGGAIAKIKPASKMAETSTLEFVAGTKGKQKPESFEEGPTTVLKASIGGSAIEAMSLAETITVTNEQEVEVNGSV